MVVQLCIKAVPLITQIGIDTSTWDRGLFYSWAHRPAGSPSPRSGGMTGATAADLRELGAAAVELAKGPDAISARMMKDLERGTGPQDPGSRGPPLVSLQEQVAGRDRRDGPEPAIHLAEARDGADQRRVLQVDRAHAHDLQREGNARPDVRDDGEQVLARKKQEDAFDRLAELPPLKKGKKKLSSAEEALASGGKTAANVTATANKYLQLYNWFHHGGVRVKHIKVSKFSQPSKKTKKQKDEGVSQLRTRLATLLLEDAWPNGVEPMDCTGWRPTRTWCRRRWTQTPVKRTTRTTTSRRTMRLWKSDMDAFGGIVFFLDVVSRGAE